jgi:putative DNA primase/helicase
MVDTTALDHATTLEQHNNAYSTNSASASLPLPTTQLPSGSARATQSFEKLDRDPTEDESAPIINEYQLNTDYGNAQRLKHYFGEDLMYHQDSWFRWDGMRWTETAAEFLIPLVVKSIDNIILREHPWLEYLVKTNKLEQAVPTDPDWIVKSYNVGKQMSAIKSATSLLRCSESLDSHKFLLNVPNGTIDLKTGELRPHSKSDYLTKMCPAEYHSTAQCPKFLEVLDKAFPNNLNGIRYLQKMFGYALTGDVSEKKLFILWGAAGNEGKTMLINLLQTIVGSDFTDTLATTSLAPGQIKAIRSDLAKLVGSRFVAAAETATGFRFNDALVKMLTGGDGITARHPHGKETTFSPELKLFLTTNIKPDLASSDQAMKRRVVIIPFRVPIAPENIDQKLPQKLLDEEKEGILAWLVQGAVMWAREGLGDAPFDTSNVLNVYPVVTVEQFIRECCCSEDKNASVKHSDLLAAYNAHKDAQGDRTPDSKDVEFSKSLTDLGVISKRGSDNKTYWYGLGLNANVPEQQNDAVLESPTGNIEDDSADSLNPEE